VTMLARAGDTKIAAMRRSKKKNGSHGISSTETESKRQPPHPKVSGSSPSLHSPPPSRNSTRGAEFIVQAYKLSSKINHSPIRAEGRITSATNRRTSIPQILPHATFFSLNAFLVEIGPAPLLGCDSHNDDFPDAPSLETRVCRLRCTVCSSTVRRSRKEAIGAVRCLPVAPVVPRSRSGLAGRPYLFSCNVFWPTITADGGDRAFVVRVFPEFPLPNLSPLRYLVCRTNSNMTTDNGLRHLSLGFVLLPNLLHFLPRCSSCSSIPSNPVKKKKSFVMRRGRKPLNVGRINSTRSVILQPLPIPKSH